MRLDHLLSKEKERVLDSKEFLFISYYIYVKINNKLFTFQCTLNKYINKYGAVAQLARAPALQAGGQEFDSPQLHQRFI